jgi:molybdenum cofactor biosynthesis enzyme MoaA
MSYEEMLRLCALLVKKGIHKIRITGGEPFVRKDIMPFMTELSRVEGLDELTLTTNGVLTAPFVPELKKIGVKSVNLSLDTLNRDKYFSIARRDEFNAVLHTLHELIGHDIAVKINAVVMDGINTDDIIALAELSRTLPVSVRYIEEMPFNGSAAGPQRLYWDHMRILATLTKQYPDIKKLQDPAYSTSANYHVPGHKGSLGTIAAYTRSFCGTCNRLRITPQGMLKTCLYDGGVLNVRDLMREELNDEAIFAAINNAIQHRAKNGHVAEQSAVHESMAAIGG